MGWGKVKPRKLRENHNSCEECGKHFEKPKGNLILHHVKNRSQGGAYTYENARLRCWDCEKLYHQIYPFGNRG